LAEKAVLGEESSVTGSAEPVTLEYFRQAGMERRPIYDC
jgi:hypothetical protein